MNNFQDKVLEFQLASGQPVHLQRDLTKEELDFRDSLLREEIRELREAIIDGNRVEILDALCDIKYVNDGTANMIGYKQWDKAYFNFRDCFEGDSKEDLLSVFDNYDLRDTESIDDINHSCIVLTKLFDISVENFKIALNRVHFSNMSKFCNDVPTAERTQEFYAKQGINTVIEPREKKFVVYREGDGKVLKSVDYYPVYLVDLV